MNAIVDRAVRAEAEQGPIVGQVWCAVCKQREPVAVVRASTSGLVYKAVLLHAASKLPDDVQAGMVDIARRIGEHPRFFVAGSCVVLLNDADTRDLEVECHGATEVLDRARVLSKIRGSKRTARILVFSPDDSLKQAL